MLLAFTNGRVLTDAGIESDQTLLVRGGRIEALIGARDVVEPDHSIDLAGNLLLPGFIDTQVNGGGGVLFNDDPSVATIAAIGAAHRRFGTTGFLPTLISDDLHVIENALDAVRAAIGAGVPGVLGIHIEGPFLNPQRKGVHDVAKLRALDAAAVKLLSAPTGGRTMITLAPEMTTPASIRALTDAGLIVSAGHSNATYTQVKSALASGLRGFTHLFNAMSQLGNREPGVVGAALEDPASFCGIIVDGLHVDPVVLRLALRCKSPDRFMLVSDAMPDAGSDLTEFVLAGRRVVVRDGQLLDEDGTLAGARLTMAAAVDNAIKLLGVDLPQAVRMASAAPAAFLGLQRELGKIEPGYRASFVVADEHLNVRETWIDGERG